MDISDQRRPTLERIEREGFSIVAGVFDQQWTRRWISRVDRALESSTGSIRSKNGTVYAARNLITEIAGAEILWQVPQLTDLLRAVLGDDFVVVRALYFDKHPERTWSLPWHKDMTIAVKDNSIASESFSKPTTKAGVPHVEASTAILQNMLTLRIHLDDVTHENGPLEVVPGSHLDGKRVEVTDSPTQKLLVTAGDVLAMRPLVSHASGSSSENSTAHRRILHFEFSGDRELPDGWQWYYAN